MAKLVFLKLGGSVITDKRGRYVVRHENVQRLCAEIADACGENPELRLIIGHGGGSFGHVAAQENGFDLTQKTSTQAKAIAHVSAAMQALNHHITQQFLVANVPVMSFRVGSAAISTQGQLTDLYIQPIQAALDVGGIPLVHGDIVMEQSGGWGIVSTEEIFVRLMEHFPPQEIILVGEVAGIFSQDPFINPDASLIPLISKDNIAQVIKNLSGSHGVDVTGGMAGKVRSLFHLVEKFPDLVIRLISGNQPQALYRTLLGETISESTLIQADSLSRN